MISAEYDIVVIANKNMARWMRAVQAGDLFEMGQLFRRKHTFHPTLLGEFIRDIKKTLEYFRHFFLLCPEPILVDEEIEETGPNTYYHTGLYNFTTKDGVVEARFTFIWILVGTKWQIMHFHSSLLPKEV